MLEKRQKMWFGVIGIFLVVVVVWVFQLKKTIKFDGTSELLNSVSNEWQATKDDYENFFNAMPRFENNLREVNAKAVQEAAIEDLTERLSEEVEEPSEAPNSN